ncbi:MAG TPA: response regulator [Verrucomicrobiae bacterium]|nr:response regulator [Verrucomicrobiae bacterium]
MPGIRPSRPSNLRQRILVVEDDPAIRRLSTHGLTCSGYQVDAAEDGAVAWVAIQHENYDLIVTDNSMPKMTGVDLLQALHEAHLKLPVIMATSSVPQDELNRHPWLKIESTLLKPYSFDELLAKVKDVLYAANHGAQESAPPPNWQGQPLPHRLQL